jgi:diguanylate cyclase (GGDEF)-like protein
VVLSSDSYETFRRKLYRLCLRALAFAAIYAFTDIALNKFAFSEGWTIFWPLNGITIALLLMRPRFEWPGILLGVAVGTGIGECLDNNSVRTEIWLRLISVTEVLLSAILLPSFSSLDSWLRRPRIFLKFTAALVVGPGVTGIMAAIYFHQTQHQGYLLAFDQWAVADAIGIAAMMPLALSITSPEMRSLFRVRALPKTLSVLAVAFAVIAGSLYVSRYPLTFLIYPTLLIVDMFLSFSGAAIVCAGFSFIAVYLTIHSHGTFGLWNQTPGGPRAIAVQAFLAFQVVALFPASILIRERRTLVEDLNSSNTQLLKLASLDGLTGVANRRSLDERFAQEWTRAFRLHTPLAFLMLDVDFFKQFNDLYGHQEGDECLRSVARILRETVHRAQDHVARFGGEEFALLLPHTDLAGAVHLADTIRVAVEALNIPHEDSPWRHVTVCLGCAAIIPSADNQPSELLKLADGALYGAKRAGRNCVRTSLQIDESLLASQEGRPDSNIGSA